jgi:hypothetical protein
MRCLLFFILRSAWCYVSVVADVQLSPFSERSMSLYFVKYSPCLEKYRIKCVGLNMIHIPVVFHRTAFYSFYDFLGVDTVWPALCRNPKYYKMNLSRCENPNRTPISPVLTKHVCIWTAVLLRFIHDDDGMSVNTRRMGSERILGFCWFTQCRSLQKNNRENIGRTRYECWDRVCKWSIVRRVIGS